MRRVLARRGDPDRALQSLLAHLRPRESEQIAVKADGLHVFLRTEQIEWIEAVGKEPRVHLGATSLLVRESMSSIARRLDSTRFVRVTLGDRESSTPSRNAAWFKGD